MQGPDKEVWIEDPGYSLTRLALVAAGAKVRPVPVDQSGISIAEGIGRAKSACHLHNAFASVSERRCAVDAAAASSFWHGRESQARGSSRTTTPVNSDTSAGHSPRSRASTRPSASSTSEPSTRRFSGTSARLCRGATFTPARLRYRALSHGPPAVDPLPGGGRRLHGRGTLRSSHPQECGRSTATSGTRWSLRSGAAWATTCPSIRRTRACTWLPPRGEGYQTSRSNEQPREHGVIVRAMSRLYIEAPLRSSLMLGCSRYPRQVIVPAIVRLAQAFER